MPNKNSIIADVLINDLAWTTERSDIEDFVENLVKSVILETKLTKLLQKNIQIEVSIVLTNDEEIQDLNKNYRGQDKPTNVLSFPLLAKDDFADNFEEEKFSKGDFVALGDVIIALETIKKEAKEQSKKFDNHLTHMIIHSILHLIGYDHEIDLQAEEMENLEIEILKKFSINNPY